MKRTTLLSITLAAALGLTGPFALAGTTGHEGHAAATLALSLNNGAKWQGDASMIQGMAGIRAVIERNKEAIHQNTLAAADYKPLAAEVQGQVDYLVQNCKLSPEADAQLHVVLGQVLEGMAEMDGGADPRAGAIRIVEALNVYGNYFDHPGWTAIE